MDHSECLTPSQSINELEIQHKNIDKEFTIISNKKNKYNIIFKIISSHLLITAYLENTEIKYSKIFTLQDIQKVKFFIIFDTIEECLEEIVEGLNMNKNYIIEDSNKINLKISLKCKKYDHIIFELGKVENIFEQKFEELYKKIKKQNDELKKEIENLKKEIKNIKKTNEVIGNKALFNCIKYKNHP